MESKKEDVSYKCKKPLDMVIAREKQYKVSNQQWRQNGNQTPKSNHARVLRTVWQQEVNKFKTEIPPKVPQTLTNTVSLKHLSSSSQLFINTGAKYSIVNDNLWLHNYPQSNGKLATADNIGELDIIG